MMDNILYHALHLGTRLQLSSWYTYEPNLCHFIHLALTTFYLPTDDEMLLALLNNYSKTTEPFSDSFTL